MDKLEDLPTEQVRGPSTVKLIMTCIMDKLMRPYEWSSQRDLPYGQFNGVFLMDKLMRPSKRTI